MSKRISYQAHFKGKVALEALKESRTLSDVAQEFKIHQAQISFPRFFCPTFCRQRTPISDTPEKITLSLESALRSLLKIKIIG